MSLLFLRGCLSEWSVEDAHRTEVSKPTPAIRASGNKVSLGWARHTRRVGRRQHSRADGTEAREHSERIDGRSEGMNGRATLIEV